MHNRSKKEVAPVQAGQRPIAVVRPAGGPIERAQQLKAEGVHLFQQKQYMKAIELFAEAIDLVQAGKEGGEKPTDKNHAELLANCHNNTAACYESLVCEWEVEGAPN